MKKRNMGDFTTENIDNKPANRPAGIFARLFQSSLFVALAISAVTLAVFLPVLNADFVMWDDDRMVYSNPQLTGLNLRRLAWIFTHTDVTRRYTPLAALNYTITYQLCRLNPFGYHLSPWLFHGLNATTVFLFLQMLLINGLAFHEIAGAKSGRITVSAAIGALVWSLHPLRTEPVAWVSAGFYSQAAFFMLLSLFFYFRANQPNIDERSYLRRIIASTVFFAAALLSHPIVIGLLAVLLVLDVYPLGKFRGISWKSPAWRKILLEKIPFAIVALAVALITVYIRFTGMEEKPPSLAQFGLLQRLIQALYIWVYYLWRPWYPVNLSPVYTMLMSVKPFAPAFIVSAILVISIIIPAFVLRRRRSIGFALVTCHLFLLMPVLGFFEHPYFPADRYSLIVSILWSVLLGAWLAYPKIKTQVYGVSLLLSVIVIVILGSLTFRQTRIWTNSKTLFTYMIQTLGDDPYAGDIHWRLGLLYAQEGNFDEGVRQCLKAVEIDPNHLEAQNDLGLMLLQKDNVEEALRHFETAIAADPNYSLSHINRAKALQMSGRVDEAIDGLDKFVRQKPDSPSGHYCLSVLLAQTGKTGSAIAHLKQSLSLDPDWTLPINDLALILAASKDPAFRDPNEAVRLANRACELTDYRDAQMLDTLAVAYASAGKFTEAVYYAEKALSSAGPPSDTALLEKIRNHLQLFLRGQAYYE